MCTVDFNYVSVYFITLRAVAAQEGPGVVIVQPAGQDVELLCNVTIVTELNDIETTEWLVNHTGPHRPNALLDGQSPGYTLNNNNNLIVKNITMNDVRNNTEYQCAIITRGTMPKKHWSDLTILYVSGEYQYM